MRYVMSKRAYQGFKLPPNWTRDSLDKFYNTITEANPEHPVSACIEKMEGKIDNPGAFCAGIKDEIEGSTDWRKGPRDKKKKKASAQRVALRYLQGQLR